MTDEVLFQRGTTLVRRLRLALGDAMPWLRDPLHRAVVLRGDVRWIEYRDGGERHRIEATPGQLQWEEPTEHLHRVVNIGEQPYEQITIFLLDRPDAVAQPNEE